MFRDEFQQVVEDIEAIARDLGVESDDVTEVGGKFGRIPTAHSQFGGSGSGMSLGLEHDRAHHVMLRTIQGLAEDLGGFKQALIDAEKEGRTADEQSAAEMRALHKLAELSSTRSRTTQGRGEAAAGNTEGNDKPVQPAPAGDPGQCTVPVGGA